MIRLPLVPFRTALQAIDLQPARLATDPPNWGEVFTPQDHEGALDPTRTLVTGDRGTGKSFWSSVLADSQSRTKLATLYPRLGLERAHVALAFSDASMAANHPSPAELQALLQNARSRSRAEAIWRSIILGLFPGSHITVPGNTWEERVSWIESDPAQRNSSFRDLDRALEAKNETYIAVFDALDTLAPTWSGIRALLSGLLQLGLTMRALKRIRIKLFVRPDMADDRRIWAVGDASKLRHNEVRLEWRRRDLYGLLYSRFANSNEVGGSFRDECTKRFRVQFQPSSGAWQIPAALAEDEEAQEQLFVALAGRYMGSGPKRGRTYTWVPNHLANSRGHAAPRSFVIALKEAADSSTSRTVAIDPEGIHEGVRKASRTRYDELCEDYRWINTLFRPLSGMLVPVEPQEIIERWDRGDVIRELRREAKNDRTGRYLLPSEISEEASEDLYLKVLEVLDHLGVVEELVDGRYNMPDLFRVAAQVRRKGGVRVRP